MALTSRLALEVDSRSAQQQVDDLRRALTALNDAGLRSGPVLSGASRAVSDTGRNSASAGAQVQALERRVRSLSSAAAGLAGPLVAAVSTKAFYDAAEAYSTLTNRMKLVTDGAGELATAQKAVFDISQSSYQPLNATAELYQRIAERAETDRSRRCRRCRNHQQDPGYLRCFGGIGQCSACPVGASLCIWRAARRRTEQRHGAGSGAVSGHRRRHG